MSDRWDLLMIGTGADGFRRCNGIQLSLPILARGIFGELEGCALS